MKRIAILKYTLGFLVFIGCIKFFIFHQVIADGNTLAVTGERVISGNIQFLYHPIPGSGPFIYYPTASLFFAPIYYLTINDNPYFSINPFSGTAFLAFIAIIYWLCFKKTRNFIDSFSILLLVIIYFGSLIWESIYIGQIDLQLIFLLICAYLIWPSNILGNFFFSFFVIIKPQFILLAISKRKNFSLIKFILTLIFLQALLTLAYLKLSHSSIYDLNLHLQRFFEMAKNGLNGGGVVNQSLAGNISRIFYSDSFGGRYWPDIFQGTQYLYFSKFKIINQNFKYLILGISYIYCFFIIFFCYCRAKTTYQVALIILTVLPTLLPAFWHVHSVYLIPPFIYILDTYLRKRAYQSMLFFLLGLLPIALVNPFVFSARVADVMLSLGAVWISSVVLSANLLKAYGPSSK
jgi:hypothetical protein